MIYFNTDEELERFFTPGPMASFRSARKISIYLVRGKLYPLERRVGFFKCGGRRCQVCLNVTETEAFSSTSLIRLIKSVMSLIAMEVPLFTY